MAHTKTHTVHTTARNLGLITQALRMMQGKKPLMLSYKFGRIQAPVTTLHRELIGQLRPYTDEQGTLRDDLTEEETAKVEALVDEEVEFEIPSVSISDLAAACANGALLELDDDSVLVYLVEVGVFTDESSPPASRR